MRTTRTVRRLLATAITAGALFALPAAAQAAANMNVSLATAATSPAEAGSTVNYTMTLSNSSNDLTTQAGAIAVSLAGSQYGAVVGTPIVVANAGTNDELVSVAGTMVNVAAGFDKAQGTVAVTIPVTLPKVYATNFKINANDISGQTEWSGADQVQHRQAESIRIRQRSAAYRELCGGWLDYG